MAGFLDWYFGIDYMLWYSIGVIILGAILFFVFGKKSNPKNPWVIGIGLLLLFNLVSVSYLNPSYWGYGTPKWFSHMQITDNHIVLYDYLTTFVPESNIGNQHEEIIPNLRIHVVDRHKQKKLYSDMIGDYYSTRIYGRHVLLVEQDIYDGDQGITSIDVYDVDKRDVTNLAKRGEQVQVDGQSIKVFDIQEATGRLQIRTKDGDLYMLDNETLELVPLTDEMTSPIRSIYRFANTDNSTKKQELFVADSATSLLYLDAVVVNEHSVGGLGYALIHAYKELDQELPYISLVNSKGEELWSKDISEFNKAAGYNGFDKIYRTMLVDSLCYVTLDHFLFEYDLNSGEMNWVVEL